MKRLSQAVAVLLCLFGTSVAAFATTGYTAVTASHIQDASGYLLASGRVTFFPVNNLGQPVSAIAYGGGIITQTGVVFLVVNGAITTDIHGNTPQIADTALTTPAHICYRIVVTNSTGAQIQGPGYALQQPTGTTFNLDTVVPNQPMQATIQTGPAGPAGAAGTNGTNGTNGIASLVELAAVRVANEPLRNLVDPTKGTTGSALNPGTGATLGGYGDWVTGYLPANAGGTMTGNLTLSPDGAQVCFYDQDKVYQSCDAAGVLTPGTVISIPSSAGFVRFAFNGASDLSAMAMVVNGSTLPGAYVAFVPVTTAAVNAAITAAVAALTEANVSPIAGKHIAFWGDSICADEFGPNWIPIVIANTSTTLSFQDCHGGRHWSGFFEDYGSNGTTGTNSPVSGAYNTGTAGHTVAQDLAGTDILVIELGTNYETVGTQGGTTAGTVYGDVTAVLTVLHTIKPGLRIVLLAPYLNEQWSFDNTPTGTFALTVQAIQYDASQFTDPVLPMATVMGFNAATEGWNGTSDTLNTFLVDGTHPNNSLGGARMGRVVAEWLRQVTY